MLRRYFSGRDPQQARFLTRSSLRWVWRHRAFTPHYLVSYVRFLAFKLRNPHVITRGFVFLGKNVELSARRGHGRLVLGRWAHIGDGTAIRAHEGTVEIGDKVVFGRDNVVNGYLDISIGESTLIADWIYICDFDHKFEQLGVPIKDQGIAKLPVRIGADCWLGTKVSVLRGTETGPGCVFAAHTVVRGDIPAYSVVAGVPGKVIKRRLPADPVRSGQQRPVGAPEIGPAQRRARPDEVDDE